MLQARQARGKALLPRLLTPDPGDVSSGSSSAGTRAAVRPLPQALSAQSLDAHRARRVPPPASREDRDRGDAAPWLCAPCAAAHPLPGGSPFSEPAPP